MQVVAAEGKEKPTRSREQIERAVILIARAHGLIQEAGLDDVLDADRGVPIFNDFFGVEEELAQLTGVLGGLLNQPGNTITVR